MPGRHALEVQSRETAPVGPKLFMAWRVDLLTAKPVLR